MRICPNCEKSFKYNIILNIFCSPWYKLRCDKCNTRIELTKKTNNINSNKKQYNISEDKMKRIGEFFYYK